VDERRHEMQDVWWRHVCYIATQVDSQCHTAPADVTMTSSSTSARRETLVSSGFLSSPNYPQVRALIADCWWSLTVQPTQTLRLTLYDFELSVKTANICRDYLRISAATLTSGGSEVTVFEDCGSRGLEVFEVASSRVYLHLHTVQSSQSHRGFLIHYTGLYVLYISLMWSSQYSHQQSRWLCSRYWISNYKFN